MEVRKTRVGIGFATGRRVFRKVLNTYVYNCKEHGLTENEEISLNLLVAYDLRYSNTRTADYTNIGKKVMGLVDNIYLIGSAAIKKEMEQLKRNGVINESEALMFLGGGYAAKRNIVLLAAIKYGIDYLIFLDDDEYPVAVTKTRSTAVWGGQNVLPIHLEFLKKADITNGHHCGYISPIPYIVFSSALTETDFRTFIEAISNDIINWDTIMKVMESGGVTYADTNVLIKEDAEEVIEACGSKFITGANLGINLTRPERLFPFYNPPGARGEDTFLGTCLAERRVLRVPCYTFHDGFSTYRHLMDGVLPTKLKHARADSEVVIDRFYRACIGWIRYKPMLLYITQRENYIEKIGQMKEKLGATLPKICAHFGRDDFMHLLAELDKYDRNVAAHYAQFLETQRVFSKICSYFTKREVPELKANGLQ